MEEDKTGNEVLLDKDISLKVTKETKFGKTIGDLRLYNSDLTMKEYDDYPRITVTAAEDLKKFQYGIIKINIRNYAWDEKGQDYLVQIDGLMSIVYSVYAKTLNDLRRATIRQKTARIHGIFKKFIGKLKARR